MAAEEDVDDLFDTATLEHIKGYFRDSPCTASCSPALGRYVVAERDIAIGEVVVRSQAYVTSILPSWKKRVCRYCFTTHPRRLSSYCKKCSQVWYCSEQCKDAHAKGGRHPAAPIGATPLPHTVVCDVLRLFSGCKADAEMQSVLFLCLDIIAQRAREEAAPPSEGAAELRYADVQCLQSHAEELTPRDRREWMKGINFLITSLRRAAWPEPIPSADSLLALVGRICANNFGMWLTRYGSVASGLQSAITGAQSACEPAAATSSAGGDASGLQSAMTGVQSTTDSAAATCSAGGAESAAGIHSPKLPDTAAAPSTAGMSEAGPSNGVAPHDGKVLGRRVRFQEDDEELNIHTQQSNGSNGASGVQQGLFRAWPAQVVAESPRAHSQSGKKGALAVAGVPRAHGQVGVYGDSAGAAQRAGDCSAAQPGGNLLRGDCQEALDHEIDNLERVHLAESTAPAQPSPSGSHAPSPAALSLISNDFQGSKAGVPKNSVPSPSADASPLDFREHVPKHAAEPSGGSYKGGASQWIFVNSTGEETSLEENAAGTEADAASLASSSASDLVLEEDESDLSPEAAAAERTGDEQRLSRETLIGRELFITASYFNHSCDPNCIMRRPFSGQTIAGTSEPEGEGQRLSTAVISTLRDIKAGEQLTISYIDLEVPVSARRDALRKGFSFDCLCERCVEELKEGSAKCSYARSRQGHGKDYTPKRRGKKARAKRA